MRLSLNIKNNFRFKDEELYYIAYFLLILNQILSQSQFSEMVIGNAILKITRWILIGFFAVLILKKGRYPANKRGISWLIFIFLSLFEMLFYDGKLLLIILFLVVIGSYNCDINIIIKTHVSALIAGVVVVITSCLFGAIDSQSTYKEFDNLTGFLFRKNSLRYDFGFLHSNVLAITFLYLFLYFIMLKKDAYKWYYDVVAVIINYIVFLYCGSRVCILLAFFAVILRWLVVLNKNLFLKIFVPGSLILLILCLMFSILLPTYLTNASTVFEKINMLFTARLTFMKNALDKYPVSLWGYGNIADNNSTSTIVIDNGFLSLFVNRGFLLGSMFVIFFNFMIWVSKKSKDAYLLLFLIIMIVDNVIDNTLLHYISFPVYIILLKCVSNGHNKTVSSCSEIALF